MLRRSHKKFWISVNRPPFRSDAYLLERARAIERAHASAMNRSLKIE
jgi:hypothetical protein